MAALTIIRNDLRLMRVDPTAPIILFAMPLVLVLFIEPNQAAVLEQQGYANANGAEHAVPGMGVLFAFFVTSYAGIAFFREHVWGTWDRIRAMPVRPSDVVLGKTVLWFLLLCAQQLVLFLVGVLLLDVDVRGSAVALVAVALSFVMWVEALILLTIAYASTLQQVLAVANLSAILFAALGGALTPSAALPDWAEAIAPATPSHWAMKGFEGILLDGDGVGGVIVPVAILTGTAMLLVLLAARRFRFDEPRAGTL
jgi:ABC-2 type transport system permease protein